MGLLSSLGPSSITGTSPRNDEEPLPADSMVLRAREIPPGCIVIEPYELNRWSVTFGKLSKSRLRYELPELTEVVVRAVVVVEVRDNSWVMLSMRSIKSLSNATDICPSEIASFGGVRTSL